MSRMHHLRQVVGVLLTICALTACTNGDPKGTSVNEEAEALLKQRVDRVRDTVDGLAQRLEGEDVQVLREVVTDCIPGREDLGRSLIYSLRMTVPPGTLDRLRGEIADKYEAEGWKANRNRRDDALLLQNGEGSITALVDEADGQARIVSGSRCVEDARGDAGVEPTRR